MRHQTAHDEACIVMACGMFRDRVNEPRCLKMSRLMIRQGPFAFTILEAGVIGPLAFIGKRELGARSTRLLRGVSNGGQSARFGHATSQPTSESSHVHMYAPCRDHTSIRSLSSS